MFGKQVCQKEHEYQAGQPILPVFVTGRTNYVVKNNTHPSFESAAVDNILD
jgi:hypothetical protein